MDWQLEALETLREDWDKVLKIDRQSAVVGSGSIAQVTHLHLQQIPERGHSRLALSSSSHGGLVTRFFVYQYLLHRTLLTPCNCCDSVLMGLG